MSSLMRALIDRRLAFAVGGPRVTHAGPEGVTNVTKWTPWRT